MIEDYRMKNDNVGRLNNLPDETQSGIFALISNLNGKHEDVSVSEKIISQVWNNSTDGMRLSDKNGRIIAVNNAYCKLVGLPKSKLEGADISSAYYPDRSKAIKQKYIAHFNGVGAKNNFESEVTLLNGQTVYFDIATSLIKFNESEQYLWSIFRDNTERKSIVRKLRLSESRLKLALDATQAVLWDWNMKTGEVYYSPNLFKILGYNPDEVIDSGNFWKQTTHPDDLEKLLKKLDEHLKNHITIYENEFRKIRKDGQIVWVLDRGKIVEWDELGRPARMTGTLIDITNSKSHEIELLKSEEKFKSLFNSAGDSIFILDFEGRIIDVNEIGAALFSTDHRLIVNRNLTEFIYNNHKILGENRLNELNKYGHTVFEEAFKSVNGDKINVEISAKIIQFVNEKVILFIGRDITERKAAEAESLRAKEKAEEMTRMKTNFLANMSHELRTPMVGILGFADILHSEIIDPNHKEMAQTILTSGQRLLETLSHLLNLSKIEAGKNEVILSEVDVNLNCKESVRLFSAPALKKGLKLDFKPGATEIISELDQRILRDILNNVLSNSIKFTDSGSITVKTKVSSEDNTKLLIEISDTGIGIPEAQLQNIFEEFRQVSEGFSRSFEGSGLGLTITKKFVEQLKGKISVESELNKGTTFTIEFPLLRVLQNGNTQLNTTDQKNSNEITAEIQTKKKVLIVEDDEISKKFLTMCIRDVCEIDAVESGDKALELVAENNYDAIFMDINLGRSMDGVTASMNIRKLPEYKNTPIIAVTAFARPEDKEEFLIAGCSHYISKPYTRNQITKLVNKIFNDELIIGTN
ncbi:MAG: PAS domain S-box protein [Ignavibacteriaceae bacterium]